MEMALESQTGNIENGPNFGQKTEEIVLLIKEFVPYTKLTALTCVFFSRLGRVKGMTARDCEETQMSLTLPTFIFTCKWSYSPFWGGLDEI